MPQDAEVLRSTLSLAPVIPVIILDDVRKARPLAEALVGGGLPVLEVTLRTPHALQVIEEMSRVPGAVVGSGTVRSPLLSTARLMRSSADWPVTASMPFVGVVTSVVVTIGWPGATPASRARSISAAAAVFFACTTRTACLARCACADSRSLGETTPASTRERTSRT